MSITQGLAILLAISMLGNAWLGKVWLGARDDLAVATTERDNARGAATACSDGVEALADVAATRKAEAAAARAKAAQLANKHQAAAQRELATPATVPGNDCQSAADRAQRWLVNRGKP